MYKLLLFLLSFLYIFGTNIPILNLDVSVIINLVLIVVLPILLKGKLYLQPWILWFFIILCFDLSACILMPILQGTYDFTIVGTKINFLISLLNVYLVSVYFYIKKIHISQISKMLISILVFQSLLIILSLLNFDFGLYIAYLSKKPEAVVKMLESYGGARGLGWANYSAFGLAIIFGVMLIILFYCYYKKFISTVRFNISLIIVIIAILSVGRTAFLGLVIGITPLLLRFRRLFFLILALLFLIPIFSLMLNYNIDYIENQSLKKLYIYAFEPFNNFVNNGTFDTSSTSHLIDDMYFPISEKQFFVGDARYTDDYGSYYLGTDAGYMRTILFYGAFLSSMLYVNYIYLSYKVFNIVNGDKFSKWLIASFVLVAFVFHYKGEVILFAQGFNKIVFLYVFYFSLSLHKK